MFCVVDFVANRVRLAIPQTTEWQRIGDQIDAAFVFARADFVTCGECRAVGSIRLVRQFGSFVRWPDDVKNAVRKQQLFALRSILPLFWHRRVLETLAIATRHLVRKGESNWPTSNFAGRDRLKLSPKCLPLRCVGRPRGNEPDARALPRSHGNYDVQGFLDRRPRERSLARGHQLFDIISKPSDAPRKALLKDIVGLI